MSITDLNFVYDFLLQVWKQDLEVVPERFHPIPSFEEHYKLIKDEQAAGIADKASSRRTVLVNERIMGYQQTIPTDFGGDIDWEFELSGFHQLDYPITHSPSTPSLEVG